MFAFGIGLASYSSRGEVLDVYYPTPAKNLDASLSKLLGAWRPAEDALDPEQAASLADALLDAGHERLGSAAQALAQADRPLCWIELDEDRPIATTAEAYLKLHLLSHRFALPNSLNLDGIFAALPNVAWTSQGPIGIEDIDERLVRARLERAPITLHALDKFPRMTDYVIPSGVRIADASRIRLGAYLGEGTTVMHEGFVNFNAGAIGPNMIEGRISQGVILGAGTDLGGSASTMGTLSGGGNITISIGENCLIGANAGTGIPLGDRCTIEAGLYITAGTPVELLDDARESVRVVKARELAGESDLLFIRNARTGTVECRTNRSAIQLNEQLHAHN
jgi:2,3,4,5-tetrahydropyridine-2-carboxylate N-succinyltransferase